MSLKEKMAMRMFVNWSRVVPPFGRAMSPFGRAAKWHCQKNHKQERSFCLIKVILMEKLFLGKTAELFRILKT